MLRRGTAAAAWGGGLLSLAGPYPATLRERQEGVWAGLRPGRASGPRVETEVLAGGGAGGPMRVVHCYGHGGSGVTLAMGCAHAVLRAHLAPFLPPPVGRAGRERERSRL